jgi:RNA polymerase sigma-70 factor (ECF subfamily)
LFSERQRLSGDLSSPGRTGGRSEADFDLQFRASYSSLVRMAEGMLHDRGAAEDVVQEAMLGLWRRWNTFPASDSPQAYLFQATRNRALNHIRHLKIRKQAEPQLIAGSASPPSADTQLTENTIDDALATALSELPERSRQVFELSRANGLKYSEIAETLGLSVKTVESHMGKALRLLREKLAPHLPTGDRL